MNKYLYLNKIQIKSILKNSQTEINNWLLVCTFFKKNNRFLLTQSEADYNNFVKDITSYYSEKKLSETPFPSNQIHFEQLLKPYLNDKFLDAQKNKNITLFEQWHLLSILDEIKYFPLGILKFLQKNVDNLEKQLSKKNQEILIKYIYIFVISAYNATSSYMSEVIPNTIYFNENIFDYKYYIPARLTLITSKELEIIEKNIHLQNEEDFQRLTNMYKGSIVAQIKEIYDETKTKIANLETFYFDDTQYMSNKQMLGYFSPRGFKETKLSRGMTLAYFAAQTLVMFLNGVQPKLSMLSTLDDACFMGDSFAKNNLLRNAMACYYYQHTFEIILNHVLITEKENVDLLNSYDKKEIDEINKTTKTILKGLAECFEGTLVNDWINRVGKIIDFSNKIGEVKYNRNSTKSIFVSPFIGKFQGNKLPEVYLYTKDTYLNNKASASIIPEDYLSRNYNMLGALTSSIAQIQSYNATRQITFTGLKSRFLGLYLSIISGAIYAMNALFKANHIKKHIDFKIAHEKLLHSSKIKQLLKSVNNSISNELTFEKAFDLSIVAFQKFLTHELKIADDDITLNTLKKAFKVKKVEEIYSKNNFKAAMGFGYFIFKYHSLLNDKVAIFLKKYNLLSYEDLDIESYIDPQYTKLLVSKNSPIKTFSDINHLLIHEILKNFFDRYYPITIDVSDLSKDLLYLQKEIIAVSENIQGTVVGKLEHEYFDLVENKVASIATLVKFFEKVLEFDKKFLKLTKDELKLEGDEANSLILNDLGYNSKLTGEELTYKIPTIKELIKKFQDDKKPVNIFNWIYNHNKEQVEILQADIATLPKIEDYGFNTSNGAVLPYPTTQFNGLAKSKDVLKYRQYVDKFNEEQQKLWVRGLQNLPKIEDLKFRKSFSGIDILILPPGKKEFENKNIQTIFKLKEHIIAFNKRQKFELEDHIKHLPEVLDYKFLIRANGSSLNLGPKPVAVKKQVVDFKTWKKTLRVIVNWNTKQEKYFSEYIESIPLINDLGFSYGNSEISTTLVKPVVRKSNLISLDAINEITRKINNYNQDQIRLFNDQIYRLPQIRNLGFRKTLYGSIIKYKKPAELKDQRPKLLNFTAIKAYANQINKFNEEQQKILQSSINKLPFINDLNYTKKPDDSPLEFPKPIFNASDIVDKQTLNIIIKKIIRFNDEQVGLHSYRKTIAIQKIKDLGFYKNDKGMTTSYPKPVINLNKLITKDDVEILEQKIINFNKDQEKLLLEHRELLPQVEDLGYTHIDGAITRKFSNNPVNSVINFKTYKIILNEINLFNESQRTIHSRFISRLPKMSEFLFETHINGKPLTFKRPIANYSTIPNKATLKDVSIAILKYNQEQQQIFHEHEKSLPQIKDLGFVCYPDGISLTCPRPKNTQVTANMNAIEVSRLIQAITAFNHEQETLLEAYRVSIPQIIDHGFNTTDGIKMPKPILPEEFDDLNATKLETIRTNIEVWNATQKNYLNRYLEKVPQIIELDELHAQNIDVHYIPKPNLSEFSAHVDFITKNEINDYITEVENYNHEMLIILTEFLNTFEQKYLVNCGFEKQINKKPLQHPLPNNDPKYLIESRSLGKYIDEVKAFSQEQKTLLNEYFQKSVPELIDSFYMDETGKLISQNIEANMLDREIHTRKDVDMLANEIRIHNNRQKELLGKLKNSLEIKDLGFRQKINGLPLSYPKPNVNINTVNNRSELIYWEQRIKLFNQEQEEILQSCILRIPNIEDLGIPESIAIKKPKNIHLMVESLKNLKDINKYQNDIDKWNKYQRTIFKKK